MKEEDISVRVKAAEIAREMGLSKATVSLALNGKPGVSEATREAVIKYKEEMEQRPASVSVTQAKAKSPAPTGGSASRMIKVIMYDRGLSVICDPALNIWPESLREFDTVAKSFGYSISITYVNTTPGDIERAIAECNSSQVAGVILFATEMSREDFEPFQAIRKPIVIYDNDFSYMVNSVVADNSDMTQYSVHYLKKKEYQRITYLALNFQVYNVVRRRIGFMAGVYTAGLSSENCQIVETGGTIEEIEAFMTDWLQRNPLPDAFIMENYRVSVGTLRAMKKLYLRAPDHIGLLGIDEVSPLMIRDIRLSCIQIDHTDRVQYAVDLLIREMEGKAGTRKQKIVSRSRILEGDTLR